MLNSKHPKHDNKASKVDRIREIVRNTEENFEEAEFGKEFADGLDREIIREKNERRKHEIAELKQEIKEETGKLNQ